MNLFFNLICFSFNKNCIICSCTTVDRSTRSWSGVSTGKDSKMIEGSMKL